LALQVLEDNDDYDINQLTCETILSRQGTLDTVRFAGRYYVSPETSFP